jgi:hypothetical protein
MAAVEAVHDSLLIGCVYDPTGLQWCKLRDDMVLAWVVDESSAGKAPVPVTLNGLPPVGPSTAPVLSPPWVVKQGAAFILPDATRGGVFDLFDFLAGNNGASRQLFGDFADNALAAEFKTWGATNPALYLTAEPAP